MEKTNYMEPILEFVSVEADDIIMNSADNGIPFSLLEDE